MATSGEAGLGKNGNFVVVRVTRFEIEKILQTMDFELFPIFELWKTRLDTREKIEIPQSLVLEKTISGSGGEISSSGFFNSLSIDTVQNCFNAIDETFFGNRIQGIFECWRGFELHSLNPIEENTDGCTTTGVFRKYGWDICFRVVGSSEYQAQGGSFSKRGTRHCITINFDVLNHTPSSWIPVTVCGLMCSTPLEAFIRLLEHEVFFSPFSH